MKIKINDNYYDVIVTYKNNKNMYLRIKNDLKIYITAPKYIKETQIKSFIESNITSVKKYINIYENKNNKLSNQFLYMGDSYDINRIDGKKIYFNKEQVYIGELANIDNFYKKEALILFKERLDYCYNLFDENLSYPKLKIRKMTSKWGVCNVTKKTVTLNLELIKMEIKFLDYVIIHELSHLIYANHSKDFWGVVSKYCPDYKKYRNEMKNAI